MPRGQIERSVGSETKRFRVQATKLRGAPQERSSETRCRVRKARCQAISTRVLRGLETLFKLRSTQAIAYCRGFHRIIRSVSSSCSTIGLEPQPTHQGDSRSSRRACEEFHASEEITRWHRFRSNALVRATARRLSCAAFSLSIANGEFLTPLRPSGCGASTLLRILAGLEVQDAGSVWIGERVVDGLLPKRRDIGMMFQSYALYPHMSVASNLALPLRMCRLSALQRLPFLGRLLPRTAQITADIDVEVSRTAKSLGIGHLLSRKPGQLSGGQRQRVAVGRAMVCHPAVFLMDEPLSNLDAKLRVQMRAEIKDLHQRVGVTFVYVTHDQAEAMTPSDRVGVMLDGELLQVAPPQDIYTDPDNRRVAEFIGSPKITCLMVWCANAA
ncbi:ABC transporter ATP-binding protein [Bradyrhizobium sp. I1.14.4]|uniref:ABC transporter ATP-binding protein n=1 Tax=unclassified Bradyrhizobium TaxID=2631580 RepID=UPI003D1DC265